MLWEHSQHLPKDFSNLRWQLFTWKFVIKCIIFLEWLDSNNILAIAKGQNKYMFIIHYFVYFWRINRMSPWHQIQVSPHHIFSIKFLNVASDWYCYWCTETTTVPPWCVPSGWTCKNNEVIGMGILSPWVVEKNCYFKYSFDFNRQNSYQQSSCSMGRYFVCIKY